jgi:hypothetical protein
MPDAQRNDPAGGRSPAPSHPLLPGRRRLNVEQLSAGIYGVVVVSAALAGAAALPLRGVVVTGFATVLVYWVAEEYAHGLALRAVSGRLTVADVRHSLRERLTMLEASFLPLLVVFGVGVIGASVTAAVTAGLLVAAGSLALIGATAARRSGMSLIATLLAALVALGLGGATVLLKLAVH